MNSEFLGKSVKVAMVIATLFTVFAGLSAAVSSNQTLSVSISPADFENVCALSISPVSVAFGSQQWNEATTPALVTLNNSIGSGTSVLIPVAGSLLVSSSDYQSPASGHGIGGLIQNQFSASTSGPWTNLTTSPTNPGLELQPNQPTPSYLRVLLPAETNELVNWGPTYYSQISYEISC